MTLASGGYPKRKAKSAAKFCINTCVFFLLFISMLGMFVGIIILGGEFSNHNDHIQPKPHKNINQ